ncbi:hypothetical protein BX600DRAFT_465753 [Xylariales sp. PMI_506]|nr:hypothetical protein BX600DRAFT_465753 [Xylariales sp. PMI_506]
MRMVQACGLLHRTQTFPFTSRSTYVKPSEQYSRETNPRPCIIYHVRRRTRRNLNSISSNSSAHICVLFPTHC